MVANDLNKIMAISLRHPVLAKICDESRFIKHLIDDYSCSLKKRQEEWFEELSRYSKETSEGDIEIERSIYSQYENCYVNVEPYFLHAMFLLCYSFYERNISLIFKEINDVEWLCHSKGFELSQDAKNALYKIKKFKCVRNNLCHNNQGTFRNEDELLAISTMNIGVDFDKEVLLINNPELIFDILDNMLIVLREICDKMEYKSILL